ncbi:MAG: hypothetical protein KBC42_03290 [Candidatus Pacebacteria bacterium]|nr:hypothetical protein [Candidatus Paceibacterota bacterium]MBP9780921.1 hypothetical protein [Candidatus Paceibacterota bacterium]
MKSVILKILTLSMLIFSTSFFAYAQSVISQNDVTVKLSPSIPGPNESVTITLQTFAFDLNKANVSWTINGKLTPSTEFGGKSIKFTTGNVGTTTSVVAEIKGDSFDTITKNILIRPAEIDLLWEVTDSYTPPFYKGKALPSSESTIRIVAFPNIKTPNGTKLKSSDFVFNWKRNFNSVQASSGYGKDVFEVKHNYLNKDETVSLVVSGISLPTGADAQLTLVPGNPKILFYEQNPLYGTLYQKELGQVFSMNTDETAIVAEPYFFSPKNVLYSDVAFKWNINGASVANQSPKNALLVRKGGTGGSTKINITIESVTKLFQSATKTLFVNL